EKNFAEFKWANFFRSKNLLAKFGKNGLPQALIAAVKLAQSDEARSLPGFDKLNLTERIEVQKVAKEKGIVALKSKKTA
nr:hypothetical protein [Bdellovibrionales bacterium]